MTHETQTELKACPCCGAEQFGITLDFKVFSGQNYSDRYPKEVAEQNHGYKVDCDKCGLKTCFWHYKSEAVEAWNTRAAQPTWKAIETAPRDGTEIIGKTKSGICRIKYGLIHWGDHPLDNHDLNGWMDVDDNIWFEEEQPTHWISIPDG